MGAYLYFKTLEGKPDSVNDFLEEQHENKMLCEADRGVWIIDDLTLKDIVLQSPEQHSYYLTQYKKGNIKTSGIGDDEFTNGITPINIYEYYTKVFEALNKKFEMRYYARSCSFSTSWEHFSLEQIKRITQNGKLLTGRKTEQYIKLIDYIIDKKVA